jgi:uncharacterized protein (TIGR02117 family)
MVKPVRAALLLFCLLLALPGSGACPASVQLEVVRHRWHTGIVIPAEQAGAELEFLRNFFPDARYYEFGWGDRRFYQNTDSIWLRVRAMLWPTDSVMHVVALQRPASELPHTDLVALAVSEDALETVREHLAASFAQNDQGKVIKLSSGLYGESLFFEARGDFWVGHTCNTWTAALLREAGLPLSGHITADAVMRRLHTLAGRMQCPTLDKAAEPPAL